MYISCNNSCRSYCLLKILLVKLKNLHISACLKLNYCTAKQRLQRWWNLSKLVTDTCDRYTFFDNFRIITQEGNIKITQIITIFFHLPFLFYLLVTFISEFENTSNSFSNSLLQSILAFKTPQFLQKLLIWTVHQTSPKSRDTLRLPKIYIMLFTCWSKIPIFLGSSSCTISDVEENFIQSFFAFLLLFW